MISSENVDFRPWDEENDPDVLSAFFDGQQTIYNVYFDRTKKKYCITWIAFLANGGCAPARFYCRTLAQAKDEIVEALRANPHKPDPRYEGNALAPAY